MLSKDDILAAPDLPTEDVLVSEWGGSVRVRGLTADARDTFELMYSDARAKGQPLSTIRAALVVRCIVDEKGERVFGDEDAAALGKKSGVAIDEVFAVCQRLSGLLASAGDAKGN